MTMSVIAAEGDQPFDLLIVMYIIVAILIVVAVIIVIVLVWYYRRRVKTAAGEINLLYSLIIFLRICPKSILKCAINKIPKCIRK